jgi:drug/metabolite transporter (DMT)-like permease
MLLALALIWGSNSTVAKIIMNEGVAPMQLVFFRSLLGASFLFAALLLLKRGALSALRGDFKKFIAIPVVALTANFLAYYYGVFYSTASAIPIMEKSAGFFILGLAWLTREERITLREILSTLLAIAGVALVFTSHANGVTNLVIGDALGIAAGFAWAVFAVYSANALKNNSALPLAAAVLALNALLMLPFAASEPLALGGNALYYLLFMGFVLCGLGYLLFYEGMQKTSAVKTSITLSFVPVIAIALGSGVLGEALTPAFITGAAMILVSVLIVR